MQQDSAGAQQADAEAQQWMDTEMQAELVNMGIASPVTKAESGARYHQELSRQVPPHWEAQSDILVTLNLTATGGAAGFVVRVC